MISMSPKLLLSRGTQYTKDLSIISSFLALPTVSDTLQPQINLVPPPGCFLPSGKGDYWAEKAINCNSDKILHKYYSSCACKQLSYSGSLTLRTEM